MKVRRPDPVATRVGAAAFLWLFATVALATEAEQAAAWLEKIAKAARQLNYSGTFVYQHAEQVETSRIFHFADRSGEYERLVTLDGPKREVIRMNDETYCLDHDNRVLRMERQSGRRNFPALIPEQLSQVTDYYDLRMGSPERIAGYDTQSLLLEPKDGFRYGHKLWADVATGLLLKAKRLNERKEVLEQFTFTQLDIGAAITREMTKPSVEAGPNWRRDSVSAESISVETGWAVRSFPAGFRKIVAMRRTKAGSQGSVTHIVYSDGLASVSVFIEPLALKRRPMEGLMRHGAMNILFRPVSDQMITVVGEAPPATILQIGNSVIQLGR
ncbi:MAG: MucB/RseB C-terminal domain-containing protein [Burkholderiales bacterium]